MTDWTDEELARIGRATILDIAPRRPDGTLSRAVPIWVVRDGDRIFVRSVNGRDAAWFRGTQTTHVGRIAAGGIEKDVVFAEPDQGMAGTLNAAYRTKYGRSIGVDGITSAKAESATLEVIPRAGRS